MSDYSKKGFVTVEEANELFASQSKENREIQELSDKINALMWSLVDKRKSKNLSQREFAKELDWKQPALARFERLEIMPRLDTFLKVAHKLGFNVYLESFDDESIPPECLKTGVEEVKETANQKSKQNTIKLKV